MDEKKFKVVEIDTLKVEEGAKELLNSPEMQPYSRYIEALVVGADVHPAMEEIAHLPLEKRYVWRVASALKWAFADFDTVNVAVDRMTLQPEHSAKLLELLKFRHIQFCMFLKELVGAEQMERLMRNGIDVAKQQDSAVSSVRAVLARNPALVPPGRAK